LSVHVTRRGKGSPLVLLHGWALNGGVFQALLPLLAEHNDVWVVDLPGHGDSPAATDATLAAWLEPIFATVPERAHWFGWSLGGMLALEAAFSAPDRVSGLTMMASTPCFVSREDWAHGIDSNLLAELAADLEQDYVQTIGRFMSLQVLGSSAARPTLRTLNDALRRARQPSTEGLRQGLQLLSSSDLRSRLPSGLPLTVISATQDRLTPIAAGRWVAGQIQGAVFQEVEGAGHAPFITHAERCAGHLRDE
jgi:pimeloyl-[acyl-carrier protein] methyl ester esterase